MPNTDKIQVPQMAWYGDTEFNLEFPSSWDVTICRMQGHNWPRLTDIQIREAFSRPFGSVTIHELAKGKKEVVILFDDLTRPTPTAELVPYILEELATTGIRDEQIRFIAATGAHRALTRLDCVKKLGTEVLDRFPVYNHNPYENCTFIGETSRGTPLSVNKEVMSCDLKIGIGCIVPHSAASFGGGGKIILPGVASIDAIAFNHAFVIRASERGRSGTAMYGVGFEDNELRLDIVEATKMVGLDIKVDVIINYQREITALFVGEPEEEHIEGIKLAKDAYFTDSLGNKDIVISNAYAKGTEPGHAVPLGARMLREAGGDMVLIANTPEGMITHYLTGSFGRNMGGRYWRPRSSLHPRIKKFILLTPYIDRAQAVNLAPVDLIMQARTWNEALEFLTRDYPDKAEVAIIPDGTIQYFAE